VSPTFTNISSNNSISSSYIDRATPTTKAVLVAAQQERRRLRRANLANLAAALEDQLQQSEEQDRLQRIQIIRRREDSDRQAREAERQAREAREALELLESASIERRRLHNATLAQARVSSVSSPTESLTSSRSSSCLRTPSQTPVLELPNIPSLSSIEDQESRQSEMMNSEEYREFVYRKGQETFQDFHPPTVKRIAAQLEVPINLPRQPSLLLRDTKPPAKPPPILPPRKEVDKPSSLVRPKPIVFANPSKYPASATELDRARKDQVTRNRQHEQRIYDEEMRGFAILDEADRLREIEDKRDHHPLRDGFRDRPPPLRQPRFYERSAEPIDHLDDTKHPANRTRKYFDSEHERDASPPGR
jgi:hypothetical protein